MISDTHLDAVLDMLDVICWSYKQRLCFVKEDLHLEGPAMTQPYTFLHKHSWDDCRQSLIHPAPRPWSICLREERNERYCSSA